MAGHAGHRSRLRARREAGEVLPDEQVLELLLCRPIKRRDVLPLARELIRRMGSLEAVLSAPEEELRAVKGVGPRTAEFLRSAEAAELAARERRYIRGVSDAGEVLLPLFEGAERELLAAAFLDGQGRVISARVLCRGDERGVDADSGEIRRLAREQGAQAVIIAHNHPGAMAIPSSDDERSTRALLLELRRDGVELLDHLVVADGDFVSFRDNGALGD